MLAGRGDVDGFNIIVMTKPTTTTARTVVDGSKQLSSVATRQDDRASELGSTTIGPRNQIDPPSFRFSFVILRDGVSTATLLSTRHATQKRSTVSCPIADSRRVLVNISIDLMLIPHSRDLASILALVGKTSELKQGPDVP